MQPDELQREGRGRFKYKTDVPFTNCSMRLIRGHLFSCHVLSAPRDRTGVCLLCSALHIIHSSLLPCDSSLSRAVSSSSFHSLSILHCWAMATTLFCCFAVCADRQHARLNVYWELSDHQSPMVSNSAWHVTNVYTVLFESIITLLKVLTDTGTNHLVYSH